MTQSQLQTYIQQQNIQNMSQDDLTKCITKFFRQPSVDRNNLARLMQYIEDFASRNLQLQMVQKLFRVAQSNMAKDNLKVVIKRYLHIINQILEKDQQLMQPFKYQQAVSAQIVPQFIIMLRNVLNYSMELFPDMKLFRKRWAKRINDQAYMAMQTEAQKQLKVNLDMGFPEEIVKKLAKSYHKRQFNKTDLDKYLPTSNVQTSSEARKSSAAVSQSSQEREAIRKRVKRQSEERVAEKRNEYSDMVMPSHSFIPSNSFTYGLVSDPRRPNQIMYRHHNQPVYLPHPYIQPNRVNSSSVGQMTGYYAPNFYPPSGSYNNYNYPNYYPQGYLDYNTAPYSEAQRYESSIQQAPTSKYAKILQKLDNLKKTWNFQCKCCGLMMITIQKYEQHKFQHFNQAQKQYEISHSRAQHTRKGNKPLLPIIQEWIESKRIKLRDLKYQVLIQDDLTRNQICMICKGQLKVSWSDQLQSWVYEDAIKTKIKNDENKRITICHADCYHTINQFQKSSDELIK